MSTPARKAVQHTRAKAYRLRSYSTQWPQHNPAKRSRKALTTKPSLKATPLAAAHPANLFISAIAGLPSLPKVSVDNGIAWIVCVCVLQHEECKQTAPRRGWKTRNRTDYKTSLIFGCRLCLCSWPRCVEHQCTSKAFLNVQLNVFSDTLILIKLFLMMK